MVAVVGLVAAAVDRLLGRACSHCTCVAGFGAGSAVLRRGLRPYRSRRSSASHRADCIGVGGWRHDRLDGLPPDDGE